MDHAPLGRTGVRVSRVCLGTATFGVAPIEADAINLVAHAIDVGVNFFDTANSYGNQSRFDRPGSLPASERASSEEILGRAIGRRRDEVVLATKVAESVGGGVNDAGLSRDHIVRMVERSLTRLRTDRIDLLYFHHPDPLTPIDESLAAVDDLIRHGKVRYVALSTYPGWQVVEAAMVARELGLYAPVCHQVLYNMVNRKVEAEVVPACQRFGLSLTCFSPLAAGLLSGAAASGGQVAGWKRFGLSLEYPERQLEAARQLAHLAAAWGATPAQLALRWLFDRPSVASAIVGAESIAELDESLAAVTLTLDIEQAEALDAVGRRR